MDYDSLNYTYVFKSKVETQELKLRPVDDDIVEADETYKLTIVLVSSRNRVFIGENATTTITIYNNDGKRLCNNNNHNMHNNNNNSTTCSLFVVLCYPCLVILIMEENFKM